MWIVPLYVLIIALLTYLIAATIYLIVLAVAFFVVPEIKAIAARTKNKFAIVVPAHNEEVLISRLCESLLDINYPSDRREIYIIADNCTDRTVEICNLFPVNVLAREDLSRRGKGYALSWAMEQIPIEEFDAIFILDADNIVDPLILQELNQSISHGERAIQCCNAVENRYDSGFTQLLFVSRTIGNFLYHHAKFKLGLSSYLMGNGLCFHTDLLKVKGWTAFSEGEDWEYYAQLIQDRIKISFNLKAKVFHQESRSLNQATSQRLRWSSGRFTILRQYGFRLFFKGLREKDWFVMDASLPLIFPNYSLLVNLTLFGLLICLLVPSTFIKDIFIGISFFLLTGQLLLFLAGAYIAGRFLAILKALMYVPIFLGWKMVIDLLTFLRLYQGNKWVRTKRHYISKD